MQVYISGQNLALWTDYTGYDPETSKYKAGDSEGGGNDAVFGIDEGTYPRTRSVTFGVKLNPTFKGDYVLPPITVEAMYSPEYYARIKSDRVIVE